MPPSSTTNSSTMSSIFFSSISRKLSATTSFFGLKLWVTILICIAFLIFFVLVILALYFSWCRCRKRSSKLQLGMPTSNRTINTNTTVSLNMDRSRLLSPPRNDCETEMSSNIYWPEKQVMYPTTTDHPYWLPTRACSGTNNSNITTELEASAAVSGTRGGINVYMLREIELATNGLADDNVIGIGGYGVVYHGVLLDNVRVAVKKLIISKSRDEEFSAEIEAMSRVRHRNLVKVLGYCTEGMYRMLVYEYVDNGNIHQWLHGCIGKVSPLTWNIRMNIILGTAKGLAYLHEDTEPAIVHRGLKSTNILLDHQWNPKVSDFGITKLLGPEWSHSAALPTGMCGYVAPEYARTHDMNEKTDVYSFGILIMEIISGKTPVEHSGTEIEAHLLDWLKVMVANQKFDQVIDPKLPEVPPLKELKRIVLIALRCVDPDSESRPKMGEIIHMLEPRDLLLSDERIVKRETSRRSVSNENRAPKTIM